MLISVFLLAGAIYADNPKKKLTCTDFLEEACRKPAQLVFKSCQLDKDSQLDVLRARYSVNGVTAEKAESNLINEFNMPEMKFACCGWDTLGGHGRFDYHGYYASVRMFSAETLIADKRRWSEIHEFFIEVVIYLEEP